MKEEIKNKENIKQSIRKALLSAHTKPIEPKEGMTINHANFSRLEYSTLEETKARNQKFLAMFVGEKLNGK